MTLVDAIFNFAISLSANFAHKRMEQRNQEEPGEEDENEASIEGEVEEVESEPGIKIKSLYGYYDVHPNDLFLSTLETMFEPNIYIMLETTPSTAYNLCAVFLEDNRTKDWYPFSKPLSLQGDGGGWGNTRRLQRAVEKAWRSGKQVSLSLRIVRNSDRALLMAGVISWDVFKSRAVPAAICDDDFIVGLQKRFFDELSGESEQDDA